MDLGVIGSKRVFSMACHALLCYNLAMHGIGWAMGMQYSFCHRTLWLACTCVLLAAYACQGSYRRCLLIHLLAYPAVFCLFLGSYALRWVDLFFSLGIIVLTGILFARSVGKKWLKIIVEGFTVLCAVPTLSLMAMLGVLGDFSRVTVQTFPFDDDAHVLEVCIIDEGALGGRTMAAVYDANGCVPVPFGKLQRPLARLSMHYVDPDDLAIGWQGDKVILDDVTWSWK